MPSIAVVHLVWLPFGIDRFRPFIRSYLQHKDDTLHDLVIVFNGVNEEKDVVAYLQYMKEEGITFKYFLVPGGQDLDAYYSVARQINNDLILFFNSYSVVLADDWLAKYTSIFENDNTGIVSASGSYQSYYSSVYQKHTWKPEGGKGVANNFRKYKLFLKAFFYWRFLFKPFPNPHVRTNAFMVRRTEFLAMTVKPFTSKFKAYIFENGRNSLTNYYLKRSLKALVVDKYGRTYEPEKWKESATFWIGDQENLLISDNQTTLYMEANQQERQAMTKLAWGE